MDGNDKNSGRRGLFTVLPNQEQPEKIKITDVEKIVKLIVDQKNTSDIVDYPSIFTPIITRLTDLINEIDKKDTELTTLTNTCSILKTEKKELISLQESYLSDLVNSHTEFDRALEIFQYHELAMVLIDENYAIYDANEAFGTLFNIKRSEITRNHPNLSDYISDYSHVCPDNGKEYFVIDIKPPIMPFDHEAVALLVLIEGNYPTNEALLKDRTDDEKLLISVQAFNLFPIPACVIDDHLTIIRSNVAFEELTYREKFELNYRDLGSSGFSVGYIQALSEFIESDIEDIFLSDTTVTKKNCLIVNVYTNVVRLSVDSSDCYLLIAVPEEETDNSVSAVSTPDENNVTKEYCALAKVLLDMSPAPTALITKDKTIFAINDSFSETTGKPNNTLIGADLSIVGILFEELDYSKGPILLDNTIFFSTPWGRKEFSILVIPPESEDGLLVIILSQCIEKEETREEILPPKSTETAQNSQINPVCQILIDINQEPLILFDENRKIIEVNELFADLVGVPSSSIIGTEITEFGIIPDSPDTFGRKISFETLAGTESYSILHIPASTAHGISVIVLQSLNEINEAKPVSDEVTSTLDSTQVHEVPVQSVVSDFPTLKSDEPAAVTRDNLLLDWNDQFVNITGIDEFLADGMEISSIIKDEKDNTVTIKDKKYIHNILNFSENIAVHSLIDITRQNVIISSLKFQIDAFEAEISKLKTQHLDENNTIRKQQEELNRKYEIVEFELSDERYAIDISMVKEVIDMIPYTPIPKTPPYVVGIINLRGEITHIVDLAVLLGESAKTDKTDQKIIIIPAEITDGQHIGIIVDNVRSVTEIPAIDVTSLGEEMNTHIHTHIKGVIRLKQDDIHDRNSEDQDIAQLVIWLDVKEILAEL